MLKGFCWKLYCLIKLFAVFALSLSNTLSLRFIFLYNSDDIT